MFQTDVQLQLKAIKDTLWIFLETKITKSYVLCMCMNFLKCVTKHFWRIIFKKIKEA